MRLDFFARRTHYIDHLAPVWNAFPLNRRGIFYVSQQVMDYAIREMGADGIVISTEKTPPGNGPILSAAYGDMVRAARNEDRKIITMEHGTGHGFGTAAYPNARIGKRDLVDLFLMPNEYTAKKSREVRPTRCEVIGTPKMDEIVHTYTAIPNNPPVIGIAFHWGDKNANPPESGSAWEHYKSILPELKERYTVIGHGHPLSAEFYREEFEKVGIEWVQDFRDVMRRADIYINDLSSTLYEFLVTGKPIIVLNAPWFRRDVHWGIRFWDYSDVGVNVEHPSELIPAIDWTLSGHWHVCLAQRHKAIIDLYPYLGYSAHRAVEVLTAYMDEEESGN